MCFIIDLLGLLMNFQTTEKLFFFRALLCVESKGIKFIERDEVL